VKEIHNQAVALEVYAYKAKDAALVREVVEIRKLAERRLGELMDKLRKAGMLDKGGRPAKKGSPEDPVSPPSPNRASTSIWPTGRAKPPP
jgi:hypothetical protein